MGIYKSSQVNKAVAACKNDMAGGERKGKMERDIASSGMRGV